MLTKAPVRAVERLHSDIASALRPPKDLSFSEWAEENFRLTATSSAAPGRFRPWKFQRGILDAIGDPLVERVSVIKSARTGYTVSLIAAIGANAVNDPSPMILLMPTDDDARGIVVDEIDPAFKETPVLRGLMRAGRFDGRNTLKHRSMMGGGSLKILSAMAPRNLRRHTAKVLYGDEVDGMQVTKEGDPIKLAEKRTMSFADRKIVMGSTPTDETTSIIAGKYEESDKRVFEIPCPHCEARFELLWNHLDWEPGEPETVMAVCPECGSTIEEKHKPAMVAAGEWRITAPWVKGHAGFRLNALISLFANASWPKLVEEFEKAKEAGPAEMQVFENTVLGKVWSTSINYVGEKGLMKRREDFRLEYDTENQEWIEIIPREVAYITAGVDVQGNRFEIVFLGWSEKHRYILGHHVVYGATNLESTWDELDSVLDTRWKHPLGGQIGIEAACVDSGDGNMTQFVYDYCEKVQSRKIVAIKGIEGARKFIEPSKKSRRNLTAPLYLVGVDSIKTDIILSLSEDPKLTLKTFRFAGSLDKEWFKQFTAEKRVVVYKAGRPVVSFERISGRAAEALDCTVYAIAAKGLCKFNFAARYKSLQKSPPKRKTLEERVAALHKR